MAKRILERVKNLRFTWVTIVLSLLTVAALYYTLSHVIALSSLAMTLAYMTIGLAGAGVVDNILLSRHSTYEQLDESPIGYALVYLGYCIIIAAALIAGSG